MPPNANTSPNAPTPVPTPEPTPRPAPQPTVNPSKPRNKKPGVILAVIVGLLITGGVGYYLGHSSQAATNTASTATNTAVTLPGDATVTAECVEGRGKQYVRPADIPGGPIYDVNEGKVVAVEYLVGLDELMATPEQFKDLNLHNAQYDHVSIVPTEAHAGLNELHFHVVSYLISADVAQAIHCTGSSGTTDEMHMH